MSLGRGSSGLSSLQSTLCLCRHVKMGTNEWGKAPDLPDDLIHSCAFLCQRLASWLPNSFPLSHGHLPSLHLPTLLVVSYDHMVSFCHWSVVGSDRISQAPSFKLFFHHGDLRNCVLMMTETQDERTRVPELPLGKASAGY